jgi:CheY-like chemotaxis protein
MTAFILEDNENRIEQFKKEFGHIADLTIAVSYTEAIHKFSMSNEYDLILLDHDLGQRIWCSVEDENTGSNFAKFLTNYKFRSTPIIIHSHNHWGASNMMVILGEAGFSNLQWIPFSNLMSLWNNKELGFLGVIKS